MYNEVINIPGHESANCRMVVVYAPNNKDIESIELWSYHTHVATYWGKSFENHLAKTFEVFGWWSATTAKHIRWFLRYIGKSILHCEIYGGAPKGLATKASVYNPLVLKITDE